MFWAACSLGTSAFWTRQSLTFLTRLASLLSSIWVPWISRWILPLRHLPYAYRSRAPRLIHSGKAASFTLVLAGILSVQCTLWWPTLLLRKMLLAPYFYLRTGSLSLSLVLQTGFGRSWLQLGYRVTSHPTASGLVPPLLLYTVEFQITYLKQLATDLAMPISYTLGCRPTHKWHFHIN